MKSTAIVLLLGCLALAQLAAIVSVAGRNPATLALGIPAASQTVAPVQRRVAPRALETAAPTRAFRWAVVESSDYREYVANLRRIGCPEQTLRDIIVADLNKLYSPREAPLQARLAAQDPAEQGSAAARKAARQAEFETRRQLREIQQEKNALFKELLGVELPLEPLRAPGPREYGRFEVAFNALPPDKREAVRQMQENFWMASDSLKDQFPSRTPESRYEQQRLKLELRDQLARVLSPAELEEYEMRTSSVGVAVAESMEGFKPTEDEFRQIYRIRMQMEDASSVGPPGGAAAGVRRPSFTERENQANEQIKAVLGETRFAEYERAQDVVYQTLVQLGERYELPKENVLKGHEALRHFRLQEEAIDSNPNLTAQQRRQALQSLKAQTQAALTQTFGQRAVTALVRDGGVWDDAVEWE